MMEIMKCALTCFTLLLKVFVSSAIVYILYNRVYKYFVLRSYYER